MNKYTFYLLWTVLIFSGIFEYVWYLHEFLPLTTARKLLPGIRKCTPNSDSPVLLNLKTKMRVLYDGGQWYHMTENFLVQHSLLSQKQRLIHGKSIWYNFDKVHFTDNLNGFTRFVIYLGTVSHESSDVRTLSFTSNPSLFSTKAEMERAGVAIGDGILIDRSALKSSPTQTIRFGNEQSELMNRFAHYLQEPMDTERHYLRSSPIIDVKNNHSIDQLPSNSINSNIFGNNFNNNYHNNNVGPSKEEICFKYMGDAGGEIVKRDAWFPNQSDDIQALRAKIRNACPINEDMMVQYKKVKPYKMVIYQRDRTRRFDNFDSMLTNIRSSLLINNNDWQFHVVMHANDRSPCELAHMLHDTDVLLTPHGFQSTLLVFLPTPALLFEVFPSPYFKPPYKYLANSLGMVHASYSSLPTSWWFQMLMRVGQISKETCNRYFLCREMARRQNVILDETGVKHLVHKINEHLMLFKSTPDYNAVNNEEEMKRLLYRPKTRETIYSQ